jgi:hypothetical protein
MQMRATFAQLYNYTGRKDRSGCLNLGRRLFASTGRVSSALRSVVAFPISQLPEGS